jgi:hypothetical protein
VNNRGTKVCWPLLLLLAFIAAACSSDGDKGSSEAGPHATQARERDSSDPIAALVPIKKSQGLLAQRGYSIGPIATDGRFLYWEAAAGDEDQDVALLERDLRTGAVATLAKGMFRAFGLATTPGGVVYATRSATGAELEVIDPSGKHRRVLSRSLAAPFDARGDVVAWAEADAVRQRVVVRNMRTGRQFVAMNRRHCRGTRCYRIDRVTVADAGVVIALGTVGQGYPSLILRRRWEEAKPELAEVAADPQPDLVPSASGALYFQLGRGWVEWNFDEARPRRTSLRGARPWLLAAEGHRQLILTGPACGTKVGVRFPDGRTAHLPSPGSSPASPTRFGPLCRQLMGYAWTGNRLLLAWSIAPKISVDAHQDVGISGMITAARVP